MHSVHSSTGGTGSIQSLEILRAESWVLVLVVLFRLLSFEGDSDLSADPSVIGQLTQLQ